MFFTSASNNQDKQVKLQITYVWGNGWVKTGGNWTGSLGLCSGAALAAFGGAAGAAFLGASDGALEADGFGAVIDGIGGNAADDDEGTPIFSIISFVYFKNYPKINE